MVFRNIKDIDYPFLHDAALVISMRYKLIDIYMDKAGGISIALGGKLTEDQVKDILQNILPQDICKDELECIYELHYSYSDDMQQTYVFSPMDIDYRTLRRAI